MTEKLYKNQKDKEFIINELIDLNNLQLDLLSKLSKINNTKLKLLTDEIELTKLSIHNRKAIKSLKIKLEDNLWKKFEIWLD